MLLDLVKKGSVDRSVELRIIDSADGTPEVGVVFNTAGIDLWYRREGAAKTSITEATLAALTDAHSDGGFLHIADGVYRFDLPDAAFATGANHVSVGGTVTGMVVIGGRVRLVDFDPENAVATQASVDAVKVDTAAILVDTGTTLQAELDAIEADVDAILIDTAEIGAAGAGLTAINLPNQTMDITGNLSGSVGSVTGGVTVTTNNDKTGYGLSAAAIQAVWDALTAALTTVGSIGKLLVDNLNATVSSRSSHSAADVWASATRLLTAGTNIVLGKGTGVTGFNDPTVGAIADQVWDEVLAEHLTAGTTGAGLNAAGGAGDPWSTAIPGAYGAGTAGKILGDRIDATISSRATPAQVNTEADTAIADAALATAANLALVKTDTAAILVDTGTTLDGRLPAALVGGRMDASVGAMAANVLTAAAINADAITDAKVASDVTIASVTGSVGSVTGAVGSVTAGVTLAASAVQAIWDALTAALTTVGSVGKLLADNLNATISSRATPAQVNTEADTAILDAALATAANLALVKTDTAAIKLKTDALPSDPADASDVAASFGTVNATLATVAGYLDTEIGAIKAKTDLLPAAPAAVGDIPTALANADALLKRDLSAVTGESARSPLNALRFSRNKFTLIAGVLTVYKEDDTTVAWTAAVTQTAGNPVTASDPA